MSYSNPTTSTTYRFPATSVTAAATTNYIIGPKGKEGRLIDIGYVVTTGVTVAASSIVVGKSGTTNAYGTLAVPISAANSVGNGMTRGADLVLPADTAVFVGSGGGATAGATDILVTIDWY
jgi:hypothetical protein